MDEDPVGALGTVKLEVAADLVGQPVHAAVDEPVNAHLRRGGRRDAW